VARDETPFRRTRAAFFGGPSAVFGVVLLAMILVCALAVPLVSPQNPFTQPQPEVLEARLPPASPANGGGTFWLGTDDQGRDLVWAIAYALRTSLEVGVSSTLIALAIGLALGIGAAYLGGRSERVLMGIAGLQLSFPAFLIALSLLALLGRGLGSVIAALVVAQWAGYAHAARDMARTELGKEYIEAARCLALSPARLWWGHLVPNCLPALGVAAVIQVAVAIALEATLSFLGLGVSTGEPSLGVLIAGGYHDLPSGAYWVSFFPGVALVLTIVSINLVANRLRIVLAPRLQR